MLSKDDVTHLAKLARVALVPEEEERLVADLGGILSYVSEVSEVVTADVGPVAGELRNVMRADAAVSGGAHTQAILENAPDTKDGFLKVHSIL